MLFHSTGRTTILAACLALLTLNACHAATTVFMDYTNFSNHLNTISLSAGFRPSRLPKSWKSKPTFWITCKTRLMVFDVSFSETPPGGAFPTLTFALSGGGFGQADHIDYRNKQAADTARTFTTSFDSFVEANEPRSQQIMEHRRPWLAPPLMNWATILDSATTTVTGIPPSHISSVAVNSMGIQNTHIMATGSTGINEVGRERVRTFSEHSMVKLSFAEGLNSFIPASVSSRQATTQIRLQPPCRCVLLI